MGFDIASFPAEANSTEIGFDVAGFPVGANSTEIEFDVAGFFYRSKWYRNEI